MSPVAPERARQQREQLQLAIRRQYLRGILLALGRGLFTLVSTIVVVFALWLGVIWVFALKPIVAKPPSAVFEFLVTSPQASEHREEIWGNLVVTLGHAGIGFVSGLVVALVVASVFQLSRGFEQAIMPIAMLLRSVPLVAMAPVIILIFGRDLAAVATIGGIVVLFPALVNIAFGLRNISPQLRDVVEVSGGGKWMLLHKVGLPNSLPSLFAAIRISVPGAITGALLAEWLATGTGIGSAVQKYIPQAQFSAVWASLVVITAVSVLLYAIVQVIEGVVLARMGMTEYARTR